MQKRFSMGSIARAYSSLLSSLIPHLVCTNAILLWVFFFLFTFITCDNVFSFMSLGNVWTTFVMLGQPLVFLGEGLETTVQYIYPEQILNVPQIFKTISVLPSFLSQFIIFMKHLKEIKAEIKGFKTPV